MIAVIELGGKQYTVEEGSILDVEMFEDSAKKTHKLESVLLLNDGKKTSLGQPYVKNASVSLSILETYKDKKIVVFKFKRKTGYKLTQGHRQELTRIKVDKIGVSSTAKTTKKTIEKETTKTTTTKKEPAKKKTAASTKKPAAKTKSPKKKSEE